MVTSNKSLSIALCAETWARTGEAEDNARTAKASKKDSGFGMPYLRIRSDRHELAKADFYLR
jgi:hypothetical protein